MSSYYKSTKPVVVHDDRYQYQRQPSANSSSASYTSPSGYHYSTMDPYGKTSSSKPAHQGSQTYRSADSKSGLKTTSNKGKVTVVNHHGSRGYDKYDPHPDYRSHSN